MWMWISFTLTHPFLGYAGYILVTSKSNVQFVVLRLHEGFIHQRGPEWAPHTKYSSIVVTIALANITNLPLILDLIPTHQPTEKE